MTTLTFLQFAQAVLRETETLMTSDEIWKSPVGEKHKQRINTKGKTPEHSLAAQLYTDIKKDSSLFITQGARPVRFGLKDIKYDKTQEMPLDDKATKPNRHVEQQLHPLTTWFAYQEFSAWCKTISHSKSAKRGKGENEWLHPDIVGFTLLTEGWDDSVVDLFRNSGTSILKLYSFELKIAIDFPTLRESFFQAVSNSSWAHAGYLVVSDCSMNPEFMGELTRLSQSFGIGVIHLTLDNIEDSEIILPAKEKTDLDWETVKRLADGNPEFKMFLSHALNSAKVNSLVNVDFFDKILDTDVAINEAKKIIGNIP